MCIRDSLKIDNVDQGNDYNVAKMMQGRTLGVNVASASEMCIRDRIMTW